jgi:hypothetical protein
MATAGTSGPVKYGPELELLTQSSRINLQIVPYLCLHQRLLDGLMAGGFFLIRAHTADVATPDLLNFLQAYAPGARTVAEARTGIAPELHPQFDWLVNACHPAIATSELDDAVAAVQDFAEMGLLVPDEQVLPRFDLTCFSSAATLRAAVTRSLADPKLCQQIQEAQRDSVVSRFTYDAGMRRAMRRIGELVGAASANLALSQASSAGARELSSVGAIGDAARRAI